MPRTPIRQLNPGEIRGFCFAIIVLMYRDRRQPVSRGIPALVCVPTGETVTIDGKRYRVLKLMYDLKAEFMPFATMKP